VPDSLLLIQVIVCLTFIIIGSIVNFWIPLFLRMLCYSMGMVIAITWCHSWKCWTVQIISLLWWTSLWVLVFELYNLALTFMICKTLPALYSSAISFIFRFLVIVHI
jgi:hypothetical protein